MNKLFIEDVKEKDLHIYENTIVIINNNNASINIKVENNAKVFLMILSSKVCINYETICNATFNIFTVDSSSSINIKLLKNNILFDYVYSTINLKDNKYEIDINHLGSNIISKIINHGITLTNNKLDFTINTIIPKKSTNIKTNQDSKIIVLKDNDATIKPNLIIDNDDIEAEHSAYIGKFKEEEIFYLTTRGITKENSIKLLVKSFLISNMNITFEEKELILNNINKYWR